jgi:hypothetical protein
MTTGTLSLAFFLAFGASSASATDKAAKDVKVDSVGRYDTATVVDFKATVTGIREVPKTDPLDGLYLTVKTDTLKSETFDVYVGPTDFVKAFEITFAKGDKIQVIGSKVKIDGVDILLAREVSRQQTTVILRGKNGDPFWKTWAKPQQ